MDSGRSSKSILRQRDEVVPTPRQLMSSRSLAHGLASHSKPSLQALSHFITKSSLKASTLSESVNDSQSGETVINIVEPDYSESQFELPFNDVANSGVFFEESIREILVSSTEEMGEILVREFLSNFLDGSEANEEEVVTLCKRLLAMPNLWEDSAYNKISKTVKLRSDLNDVSSQSRFNWLEETITDLNIKILGENEKTEIRRELRKLYYQKACRVTRSTVHSILMDALIDARADKGIIEAPGRGGKNQGTLSDSDILAFVLCVKYGLRVTYLNLSNNEITDFGMWHLSHLFRLSKLNKLVHFDISDNNLTDRGISIFAEAIKDKNTLKTIILRGNKMSEFGGLNFVSSLKVNEQLTKLDLCRTDMEMRSIVALLVVVSYHPSLLTLKLGRPLIFSEQEEPLLHLCDLFKVNYIIRKVCVPKFSITDFGVTLFVPGLMQNNTLVYLDLSCNKIVWDGAKFLSEYIKNTRSLKVLNLNANRLEDPGAIYIAQALAKPAITLQKLTVTNNGIGIRGLCALATSVHKNQELTNLYVWGNKMKGRACLALSSLLTSGRLKSNCVDFIPYKTVDGIVSLALARN